MKNSYFMLILIIMTLLLSGCVSEQKTLDTNKVSDANQLDCDATEGICEVDLNLLNQEPSVSEVNTKNEFKLNSVDDFTNYLASGAIVKCSFNENNMDIMAYISKDNVKSETIMPEYGLVYSQVNLAENVAYIWSEKELYTPEMLSYMGVSVESGKKIGTKVSLENKSILSQNNVTVVNAESYKPEWKCELSQTSFDLPTNYQFIDLSSIMPTN